MSTLYLDRLKIYQDGEGGVLNQFLSYLINLRVTTELRDPVQHAGEQFVVMKQNELPSPILRDFLFTYMDHAKDFFNGLRVFMEYPEGTLDLEVPDVVPAQFREFLDEEGQPSGVVKKNREFYGIFYEKAGLEDLILCQYAPNGPGGDLLPIYAYNADGSENISQAETRWKYYWALMEPAGQANLFNYFDGQSKIPNYEEV